MSDEENGSEAAHQRPRAVLPRTVQEHLGRRLRTALHVEADKPAYLGESNVPPQFAPLVRKLEASERGERQGYEAVKRALTGETAIGRIRPPRITPKAE